MKSKQIDKKLTKQIRIDAGLHRLLKLKATDGGMTIKECLEGYLGELLAVDSSRL